MTIAILFWILYIVGLVFFGIDTFRNRDSSVQTVLFWALIGLLGYGAFGGPLK